MEGVLITYELKRGCSSKFNQKMFGRISTKKTNNGIKAYYIPGILDKIPHYKIFSGRIFIATTNNMDFDSVMPFFTKFNVTTTIKEESKMFLRTANDKWKFHADERGIKLDWN